MMACAGCRRDEHPGSSRQLLQQRLRLFQIERIEALGEPAVDRSEQLAGLIPLALIAPESGKAGSGAQFGVFCTLPSRDAECLMIVLLGSSLVAGGIQ
jgi:hypothetical protein